MKLINYLFSLFIIATIVACGGNSSEETLPEVISLENFSLKVQQSNLCEELSPLSNATILVYDESPNQNSQSEFTTYTTGEDGLLELDLDINSQISFTVIANTHEDYYIDERVVKSFIDVDVDNYSITMLYATQAFNNDNCECQSVPVEAEVNMVADPEEFVTWAQVYWGNNYGYSSYRPNGSTVSFSNIEVCGDAHESMPIVVEVLTAVQCADCVVDYIMGMVENPDYSKETIPVQVNTFSQLIQKPDYLSNTSISHSRSLNNVRYLNDSGAAGGLLSLDEFDLGQHRFIGNDNGLTGNYNNISISRVGSSRISYQNSSDLSLFGEMPTVSSMDVQFDESNRAYEVEAAGSEDYELLIAYNSYAGINGEYLRWTIYSPNTEMTFFPKLTAELESDLNSFEILRRRFTVRDYDGIDDYSESLKRTFLNVESYLLFSRREISLTYDNDMLQEKIKDLPKHKDIEIEF